MIRVSKFTSIKSDVKMFIVEENDNENDYDSNNYSNNNDKNRFQDGNNNDNDNGKMDETTEYVLMSDDNVNTIMEDDTDEMRQVYHERAVTATISLEQISKNLED